MTPRILLLIGTKKGLFVAESDAARQTWSLRGPYCEHWPINHAVYDPASRAIWLAPQTSEPRLRLALLGERGSSP